MVMDGERRIGEQPEHPRSGTWGQWGDREMDHGWTTCPESGSGTGRGTCPGPGCPYRRAAPAVLCSLRDLNQVQPFIRPSIREKGVPTADGDASVPAGTQSTPAARCTPHPTHAPCCWPACACCPCPARPPRLVSVRRRPMCHRAGRIKPLVRFVGRPFKRRRARVHRSPTGALDR